MFISKFFINEIVYIIFVKNSFYIGGVLYDKECEDR